MTSAPPPPDPVMVLSGSHPVTCLTFDDNGVLFSGHQNGQIQEWNPKTQRTRFSWTGHHETVISLCRPSFNEHHLLVSQGREGVVNVWRREDDQSSWTLCQQIPCAKMIFCNTAVLAFNNSIFLAVPCDETAKIQVYKLVTDNSTSSFYSSVVSTLEPASVKEYGMCMKMCSVRKSKAVPKILVGYESGAIALWDVESGVCLAHSRMHQESVMCLDSTIMETDSETIVGVSGSADKTIHKWIITDTSSEIVKCQTVDATNPGFCDIKIRQDGRIFVSGGWDSASRVFTLKKLRPLAVLSYHKQSVQCLSFSGDKTLVTGSKDGYIAFWDVYKNA